MTTDQKMDYQSVKEKLLQVIKPYLPLEIDLSNINDNADLIADLKINSTRFVDIILDMEDKFGIAIDDSSSDSMLTVGDAIDTVLRQKS